MSTDILTSSATAAPSIVATAVELAAGVGAAPAASVPDIAWVTLLLLGAAHGINPAMGWLFAVSLGLQSRDRRAVWGALAPLALGHAVAIGVTVAAVALVGRVVPMEHLKWIVASLLVSVGIAHLIRHRHPRFGGMRVGARDLAIWSFLVATAHGAGLMAVPFLLGKGHESGHGIAGEATRGSLHDGVVGPTDGAVGELIRATALPGDWVVGLLGSAVHAAGYLAVTALIGGIVYEWMGLRLLRKAWINLDLIWAGALVLTGVLTPFM